MTTVQPNRISIHGEVYVRTEAGTFVKEAAGLETMNRKHPQKHVVMTPQQKLKLKRYLKTHKIPKKKKLVGWTQPVWRRIKGRTKHGCWEVVFSYQMMSGPRKGMKVTFTRCVGYTQNRRPRLRKIGQPPYYQVVFSGPPPKKAAKPKVNRPKKPAKPKIHHSPKPAKPAKTTHKVPKVRHTVPKTRHAPKPKVHKPPKAHKPVKIKFKKPGG